jgi:hypothetical protein
VSFARSGAGRLGAQHSGGRKLALLDHVSKSAPRIMKQERGLTAIAVGGPVLHGPTVIVVVTVGTLLG